MAFGLWAFAFMFVGRKVGWALSKSLLYTGPAFLATLLCLGWGLASAGIVRVLIDTYFPGAILRWVLGYALGAYVAVPNYGLFVESSVPDEALPRHFMVSNLSFVIYIVASGGLAFWGRDITKWFGA